MNMQDAMYLASLGVDLSGIQDKFGESFTFEVDYHKVVCKRAKGSMAMRPIMYSMYYDYWITVYKYSTKGHRWHSRIYKLEELHLCTKTNFLNVIATEMRVVDIFAPGISGGQSCPSS